jgi:hypothetical protein
LSAAAGVVSDAPAVVSDAPAAVVSVGPAVVVASPADVGVAVPAVAALEPSSSSEPHAAARSVSAIEVTSSVRRGWRLADGDGRSWTVFMRYYPLQVNFYISLLL